MDNETLERLIIDNESFTDLEKKEIMDKLEDLFLHEETASDTYGYEDDEIWYD